MTTKTNLLPHIPSSDAIISRWRWLAIIVSLVMALLASAFILLLSNAVDREVAQLNTSSELREQADLVLISLIDMAVADRSYAKTTRQKIKHALNMQLVILMIFSSILNLLFTHIRSGMNGLLLLKKRSKHAKPL